MSESQPPIRVLHIEDNAADAEIVRRFLSLREGPQRFVVTQVGTVADGIDRLQGGPFDVVLLDESLPDSKPPETFKRVFAAAPRVPIVVLTGTGDEELGPRRVREGAQDFLEKSHFDAALLIRVVRYAIERLRLVGELEEARRREQYERELRQLERLGKS